MKPQTSASTKRRWMIAAVISGLFLAACELNFGGTGPVVNSRAPVAVALLLPYGSEESKSDILATSLQNAAQLAVNDLKGAEIDLRIYKTGGQADTAAEVARQAVNDGAKIIVGPVFADAANAVGAAVKSSGVRVLSFSNNTSIAGGNVFVLGHTFENTAERLVDYAATQGFDRVMVVHADNLTGQIGQTAVQQAATNSVGTFTGASSYEFSQQGVISAVHALTEQIDATDTNAIVFTSDTGGALPILSQLLPENGVDTSKVKFLGLTRWDIPTQTLSLPGLQGGWFALPDPALAGGFRDRYLAAYGQAPHPLAGIAYDAIAAIGALLSTGKPDALSQSNLTQSSGFAGVHGVFRLMADGTNERGMAVVEVENNQVKVIDPAPRSFGSAGL